jgi:hypothetical protein
MDLSRSTSSAIDLPIRSAIMTHEPKQMDTDHPVAVTLDTLKGRSLP